MAVASRRLLNNSFSLDNIRNRLFLFPSFCCCCFSDGNNHDVNSGRRKLSTGTLLSLNCLDADDFRLSETKNKNNKPQGFLHYFTN